MASSLCLRCKRWLGPLLVVGLCVLCLTAPLIGAAHDADVGQTDPAPWRYPTLGATPTVAVSSRAP
jgi:hypothetical protein